MSDSPIRYSLAEVAKCNGKNGARTWIVIYDNVYDVTDYKHRYVLRNVSGHSEHIQDDLRKSCAIWHPGGTELIEEYAGKDATNGFEDFGHSSDAKKIMKDFLIGEIEEEDKRANRKKKHIVNELKTDRRQQRTFLRILCGRCTS